MTWQTLPMLVLCPDECSSICPIESQKTCLGEYWNAKPTLGHMAPQSVFGAFLYLPPSQQSSPHFTASHAALQGSNTRRARQRNKITSSNMEKEGEELVELSSLKHSIWGWKIHPFPLHKNGELWILKDMYLPNSHRLIRWNGESRISFT